MTAEIIDGKAIASQIEGRLKADVDELAGKGVEVSLCSLLVGDSDASKVYRRVKELACKRVGVRYVTETLPADATQQQLGEKILQLNADAGIHALILEMPLPKGLDTGKAAELISPMKDADCLNSANIGRLLTGGWLVAPATARAVVEMLDAVGVKLEGCEVAIVSHSAIVGKPLALLLLGRNATVHVSHVFTKDAARHTREADVLVTAAGVPGLIKPEMVKAGAVVIDVAMNRVAGKLCGDVDFDAVREKAGKITPVPGGVGPVTTACLLQNAVALARASGRK